MDLDSFKLNTLLDSASFDHTEISLVSSEFIPVGDGENYFFISYYDGIDQVNKRQFIDLGNLKRSIPKKPFFDLLINSEDRLKPFMFTAKNGHKFSAKVSYSTVSQAGQFDHGLHIFDLETKELVFEYSLDDYSRNGEVKFTHIYDEKYGDMLILGLKGRFSDKVDYLCFQLYANPGAKNSKAKEL